MPEIPEIVAASIALRVIAAVWSAMLAWRLREWGMAFLAAMITTGAVRQAWTVQAFGGAGTAVARGLENSELPGLGLSVMAVLAVFFLRRMLEERARASHELARARERNYRLHKAEALSRLAGGVAHDFNNLFAAISGHVEMALRQLRSRGARTDLERLRRHLNEVLIVTERGELMVEQILSFGHSTNKPREPVSLRDLVDDVTRTVRPTLRTGVALDTDIDPRAEVVIGDSVQLYRALVNLCTNAADATRRTGSRIEVTVEPATLACNNVENVAPGAYASVCVRDDGCGLPQEAVARAFEPYFTTKQRNDHAGLGLWVVEGVATAHGGTVRLTREPDGRTCARLLLPLGTATPTGAGDVERARSTGADTTATPAQRMSTQ